MSQVYKVVQVPQEPLVPRVLRVSQDQQGLREALVILDHLVMPGSRELLEQLGHLALVVILDPQDSWELMELQARRDQKVRKETKGRRDRSVQQDQQAES